MASGRTAFAASGFISGCGLANAKIIGRSFIVATISGFNTPPADRPKNMSASFTISASTRADVLRAYRAMAGLRFGRPSYNTPSTSETKIFSGFKPNDTSISRQAIPAAPAPLVASFTSEIFFPTTNRALRIAAPTIIAVPCWSSWNTGIFMRSRNLRSTSKHSGALMSSRLMPPKVGSRLAIISTSLSGSFSLISRSNTSIPANF